MDLTRYGGQVLAAGVRDVQFWKWGIFSAQRMELGIGIVSWNVGIEFPGWSFGFGFSKRIG